MLGTHSNMFRRDTWPVADLFFFFSKQNNSSLNNERLRQSKLANLPPQALKHLWIRTALIEKLLDKIVLYLVENSRYYILVSAIFKRKKTLRK